MAAMATLATAATAEETPMPDSKSVESSSTISDDAWLKMKSLITEQLYTVNETLDDLQRDGTMESISQYIQRGDKFPSARVKAWYHAMLEVECCNRPEVVKKLEHMFRIHTHTSDTTNGQPKSFVLDTTITAQMTGKEDWRRRSGRPLEPPASVVARLEGKTGKLTLVERQELWLAKKNIRTAEIQSRKAEESMLARAKSAPDISRSQRSFVKTSAKGNGTNTVATNKGLTRSSQKSGTTLGNITNNNQNKKVIKTKKRDPISDPFNQKATNKGK